MVEGSTESNRSGSRTMLVLAAGLATFGLLGMASGLWIHLGILAVAIGIFMATVTMRRSSIPASGVGARIIRIAPVEEAQLQDLDEVA